MKKARDLMVLAMEAFRKGQYEGCAKFFAESMACDDLGSFVDYIADIPDGSALHGNSEGNTFAPSLASDYSDDDENEFTDIVNHLNGAFSAEMSARGMKLDEPIEEVEVRANVDDPELQADMPYGIKVTAGPVRIR